MDYNEQQVIRGCRFCRELYYSEPNAPGVQTPKVVLCPNPKCGRRWQEQTFVKDDGRPHVIVKEISDTAELTTRSRALTPDEVGVSGVLREHDGLNDHEIARKSDIESRQQVSEILRQLARGCVVERVVQGMGVFSPLPALGEAMPGVRQSPRQPVAR